MAGVKGKSGGARSGAGRKPTPKPKPVAPPNAGGTNAGEEQDPYGLPKTDDGLEMLKAMISSPRVPLKEKLRASIALAQYQHTKKGDGGKKEEQAGAATKAAKRYAPAAPPKLVAAGGKKV